MSDAPSAALSLPFWRVERILSDCDGLLIIDKPTGMPTYGGDESLDHGVVARLERHLAQQGRAPQLGVFQRLDQDTSGLLVFSTDAARNAELSRAISRHELERSYHAVVELPQGIPAPLGRLRFWLRHQKGRTEVFESAQRAGDAAKEAITHVRQVARVGQRCLLECRLETGRTHQIRACLAHLGAPIVGDRRYGGAAARRLMLDSFRLAGAPLGEEIQRDSPVDLQDALTQERTDPSFGELRQLLQDALSLRAPLLGRASALRLVNGEADGLPGLTIDAYGRFSVVNLYDPGWMTRLEEISALLQEHGSLGVYLKKRVRADLRMQDVERLAPDVPVAGERAPDLVVIHENGLHLQVDLHDGLSTGVFVDMRDNRARVAGWLAALPSGLTAPPRVLNLFSYTCSFSVAAALAGAHTTSIDLSARALERGRANFIQNGLDPQSHRFFKEDAMKFLTRSVRRNDLYHFIVLDPPSFSTGKKDTFSVKSSYQKACVDCLRLLAPGGKLLCVTNHTKTSPRAFLRLVADSAREAGRLVRTIRTMKAGLDCGDHSTGPWPSKSLLVEVE